MLAFSPAAYALVSFSALDLSPQNGLLFEADARSPDFGTYTTLFLADLNARSMRQLTFFPEQVLLLHQNDVVQIQNRYGVFRSEVGFGKISPIPLFPSFVSGSQIQGGRIPPMQTSPDGRFLLYLQARSAGYGDLTLFDIDKSRQVVISEHVEASLQEVPAVWSPDSSMIAYRKATVLYYYSLTQLQQGRVVAENLRRVGDGGMANLRWGSGTLYFVSGSIVYAIDPNELFTRALYSGFLNIGRVEGRIPFIFDPNFDSFWVSPDGKRLLVAKGGHNIFLFNLRSGDFHDSEDPASLPYLYLPRDTTIRKVLWSSANAITILCDRRDGGTEGSVIFRLVPDSDGKLSRFQAAPDMGVMDIALSPNEKLVALMRAEDVVWKDYVSWNDLGRAVHPSPLHVNWLSDDELLIAGVWYTERYSLVSGQTTFVALSQAAKAGYARDGMGVVATASEKVYAFDPAAGGWTAASAAYTVRVASLVSSAYRVYLETSTRGSYENLVMLRDLKGFGTTPLFPSETAPYEAFPAADQDVDFSNFTHGSRIRRREVSLVFNAIDSVEGLTEILNTLSAFRVRSTFFVNGELIRRYPEAVREIALSGHEVGSLFSAYFNMTDDRFKVDADFIKSGLARNEDDYFAAAARELSLLWHAPYYIVNSDIIAAGRGMNYTYVGRDLDTYDWVTDNETNRNMGIYLPSAMLVDRIIGEKKPGSIIPILVGPPSGGGRDDYLYKKIDLIMNELIKLGYEIVPVTTLIEHAR